MNMWDIYSIIFMVIIVGIISKNLRKIIDGFLFTGRYEIGKIDYLLIFISFIAIIYTNSNSEHSVLAYCYTKILQFKDWLLHLDNKLWIAVIVTFLIAEIVSIIGRSSLSLIPTTLSLLLMMLTLIFNALALKQDLNRATDTTRVCQCLDTTRVCQCLDNTAYRHNVIMPVFIQH